MSINIFTRVQGPPRSRMCLHGYRCVCIHTQRGPLYTLVINNNLVFVTDTGVYIKLVYCELWHLAEHV